MLKDSKDAIKNRMIRTASGVWGFPETQDVNAFDPIVGMILGALAEELYALSGEIKKADARLVEKLFELLFNQPGFTHQPAHALARATPTQPVVNLTENYQFSCVKKIAVTRDEETLYENKTIHFTPTAALPLFRGEVKYLFCGNQLFEISDQLKEPLGTADSGLIPDFSRLYIGLQLDPQIELLDGLSLLFTLKNIQNEEWFARAVSLAVWKINGLPVEAVPGFEPLQPGQENTLLEMVRAENDVSYKTCRFINALYEHRFMMLKRRNHRLKDFFRADSIPGDLKSRFPAQVLKSIPKELYWLELTLPRPLPPEVAADLTVRMNCFPVINRELNEFSYLLSNGVNIIPLPSEALFFDILKISDTKGVVYKPLNSFSLENGGEEGYLIRQGGVARFDSRDAKETLTHLVELIRDERAGFSLLGADLIASELRQLDQIVARLRQRLEASANSGDPTCYALLNSNAGYERASVQFWTTGGEAANNLRADTRLTLREGSDLDMNSISLVTHSSGGRQKLSGEDKLDTLRRTLLSKGRVVTREDISALCFEHFGSDLLKVEIRKGVQLDPSPAKGFIRSLDIHLHLNNLKKTNEQELAQRIEGLKVKLRQESLNLLPYRFFTT